MRGPLAVRVKDDPDEKIKNVTRLVKNLRWTKTAYGGDTDLSCTIRAPRHIVDELGPGDRIEVFDTSTGEEVWSGNTDNPGKTASRTGVQFDLQALGAATRLVASTTPLGYVVTRLDIFDRSANSVKRAKTSTDERRDGTPTLMIDAGSSEEKTLNIRDSRPKRSDLPTANNAKWDAIIVDANDHGYIWDGDNWNDAGHAIMLDWQGEWATRTFRRHDLSIARVRAEIQSGVDAANYQMQILTGDSIDDLQVAESKNASRTAGGIVAYLGDGKYGGLAKVVAFRVVRNTGRTIPTDKHWFEFWNPVVRQTLRDRHGDVVTGAYESNTVYAHQVINDMIGRGMMPGVHPDQCDIARTDYPIDSLDWLDGISAGDALQELLLFEPDMWWKAAGKTFETGFWNDQEPRYVIGAKQGGITMPGEEFSLCNRIAVSWTDSKGREHTEIIKVDVEGLSYTKDAEPITLPDGMGSENNAIRAGKKALEYLADPPRSGSAVVRIPIYDQWQGCMVRPHEIEPGCRVVNRENGDVLRLTEVEYQDNESAATLTLGDPVRTVDQYVARLHRRQRRRRRRR